MVAPQPALIPTLRRRLALNLSLALIIGGLAVVVYFVPPGQVVEQAKTLVPAPAPDIHTIQVERHGKLRLLFQREDNDWMLRVPVVAPAHPRRIRDLLTLPSLPVHASLDIKADELPRFNLDPPLAVLRLDDYLFEFGGTDGLDEGRYVRYQQQVHLVPDNVYPQLTQGAGFFIDPRLLKEGLRPTRIAAPHRMLWRENNAWHSEPAPAAGEPAADAIATAWESAEALSVSLGADAPGGQRIALTFAGEITIEFDFVEHDGRPTLLRRDLNLSYNLDPEQARSLMLPAGADTAIPATE